MSERTAQRLAQFVAVVLAQPGLRRRLVQAFRLKDEAQVVEFAGVGELIHLVERELNAVGCLHCRGGARLGVEAHLAVPAQEHEMRVRALDARLRLMSSAAAHCVDIEFVGVFLL